MPVPRAALGGVDAYRPPWPYPDGSRVQLLDSMYQPAAEALLLHCRPSDKYHGVPVGPGEGGLMLTVGGGLASLAYIFLLALRA
jgi:hypothetical protein